MASEDLLTGDPVWAKMKGYPPWPAKIVDPPSDSKTPKKQKASYVLFFGTGDYAWILNENIIPHSESMLMEAKNRKKSTAAYQNGIDELVSYSKSYKRVKHPKVAKKDIVENNNNVSKSKVQVMKVFNSVPRKNVKKSLSMSLLKKAKAHKKRSLYDFNGKSSDYLPSKLPKMKLFSPSRNMLSYDIVKPVEQNVPIVKTSKHVKPSNKSFGFIGLGMMGKQIVKALLESGHKITVWNKTATQCDTFLDMGAKRARYPADLVYHCDIIFSCVADPEASKAVLFGENGVLTGLENVMHFNLPAPKGFVEMTTIDPETSQKGAEAVEMKGGIYLEAPFCGTSKDAEEGSLLILAAGERKLFSDCETCFHAIAKSAFFVSCNVGDGSKMSVILSTYSGIMCGAIAEAMVLVERLKLQKSHFLELLESGPVACKSFIDKARKMKDLSFEKETALKYIQKDIGMALSMGNRHSQKLLITSAANDLYKHGRLRNYSNEDMSAVYKVVKY